MAPASAERRRFQRFRFSSVLRIQHGDEEARDCALQDMSFRGFLARCPEGWQPTPGDRLRVEWRLAELIKLELDAVVMHVAGGYMGCSWEARDVQSFAHLKRLVELNLGDARLMARELKALRMEPIRQFPDALH